MSKLPKIKVFWLPSPFYEDGSDEDDGKFFPVLTIDTKVVPLRAIDGQRPKYICEDFVVKVDREPDADANAFNSDYYAQSVNEVDLWKRISRSDRKYFPKLLKANLNERWTVQKFVRLTKEGITEKHCDLVSELARKYGLTDVDSYMYGGVPEVQNWALDADTGLPVIFDYGV